MSYKDKASSASSPLCTNSTEIFESRRVSLCCIVLQCVAVRCSVLQCGKVLCSVLQRAAVCCSVLQCVAVCCSVLQCVLEYSRTRMFESKRRGGDLTVPQQTKALMWPSRDSAHAIPRSVKVVSR